MELVFTWPEWVQYDDKGADDLAKNAVFKDVQSKSTVPVLRLFESITDNSVLISFRPWWPFRQVIADYLFDKVIYPVVIICEPCTPGFHVYPQDRTAYANMYDPPSPFCAQLFQRYYRTIDLYEWDHV
jgi:hypothetical protein